MDMDQKDEINNDNKKNQPDRDSSWMVWVILLGILLMGAYFPFIELTGVEQQHLHPDERFTHHGGAPALLPVKSIAEFSTRSISSLNPNNRGVWFLCYGTLPLFLVRYVAEWIGQTG
jgi:hypothetical protein